MNEKMQKALSDTLRPGEAVLWESATEPFRITDGREGRRTLLCWIVGAAAVAAMTVFFVTNGAGTARFYAIMAALLALFIVSPLLSYRQVLGQYYVLTSERAILLRRDGTVYAMDRKDAAECRVYPMDFGGASLSLGAELTEEKDRQLRWRSNHPKESADSNGVNGVRGLVFYHVSRASEAMRLLQSDAKEA